MGRTRLAAVAVTVAAVLAMLTPTASALCLARPLAEVVGQADTVVVARIADADASSNSGIVLTLSVEEVLKGSAEDARRVTYSTCGLYVDPKTAKDLVGKRDIYFLNSGPHTARMYGDVIEPQVSTEERITLTRSLLGIDPPNAVADPLVAGGSASLPIAGAVLVVAVIGVGWFVRRRRARST
jgi:hypothetical protein